MAVPEQFDFVIFGSGFGGSILAMVLRRLGRSVLLLERCAHPRFAIGESSTPFANLLLERLAAEYDLPFLRSFSEWGRWQAEYPQIPAGLKRGFTFYHHAPGQPLDFRDRDGQLLVAASPNDRVADTHWYRPEFDHFLVQQAEALGVTYLDNAQIEQCSQTTSGWDLRVRRHGASRQFRASFAIDASGASGFLSDFLNIAKTNFSEFPRTHAIYAHFRNVARLEAFSDFGESMPPYPPDDAAVHHLCDRGWIWVLRFNNGITSAGAALRSENTLRPEPEKTWRELLGRFPSLEQQFARAEPVTAFHAIQQLAFRRTRAAGRGWALLPSSVGFVDPLLSTGFALNLLGVMRLGYALREANPDLREYERDTFTELDAAADLIGGLYARMDSFPEFASLSFLYFAALSYTETAWRLGKEYLASLFLLANNLSFSAARQHFCAAARAGQSIDSVAVAKAIERWNIAGLANPDRRNWYPVSFADLESSPEKFGCSRAEIERLIEKLR